MNPTTGNQRSLAANRQASGAGVPRAAPKPPQRSGYQSDGEGEIQGGPGIARALVREQLKHGPRPGAQVEAAAQAAAIPKPVLLAATDALGVRTRRGEWRLPWHDRDQPALSVPT